MREMYFMCAICARAGAGAARGWRRGARRWVRARGRGVTLAVETLRGVSRERPRVARASRAQTRWRVRVCTCVRV